MDIIKAMLSPETYPHQVKKIEHLETHISHVFLTGKYAYKIKKPVNLGFLDFTTLAKRKKYCELEVKVNKPLAGKLYLGVVEIKRKNGRIKMGGKGKTAEYAVKMLEIPQEKIMAVLLKKNKIGKKTIRSIAKMLVKFHGKAEQNKRFGSLKIIRKNWEENFEQARQYAGRTITKAQFDFIKRKIRDFIKKQKTLLEKRIRGNKIKACHGDMHSGNIFIADNIYIFDAIEFNERFRHCDVASEIAFLAMDLEFHNKKMLSDFFIKQYIKYSKDYRLQTLLTFYKCYRAFVRGKVESFSSNYKKAKKYFRLAYRYANCL